MTAHQREREHNPWTTHNGYYTTLVALPPDEPTPSREPGPHYHVSVGLAACTSALAPCLTLLQEREAGASNTIACGPSAEPGALGLVVSGRSPARLTSIKPSTTALFPTFARTCTASASAAAAQIVLSRRNHHLMQSKEKP
jgi:hypothetical protein